MTSRNALIIWLGFSAFMVFAMAVIGAITRLTESGLSMVEWRPLIGWIPPLSETEWQRVFDLYRATPEYIHKNAGMDLAQFRTIFFWEWLHRVWGRLIGIVYALPLLIFWLKGMIPQGMKPRLLLLLGLGALQGVIGWWMVASGLIDRPSVSHYRLAVHLGVAFVIFGLLLWTIFDMAPAKETPPPKAKMGWVGLGLLTVTIIWGAFVAGLDAGLVYNSFPKMDESWLPAGSFGLLAPFTEHGWVQFTHRWLAILAGGHLIAYAVMTRQYALGGMVVAQIGLGIATLLTQVAIPLAALHQAGALILLALLLAGLHAHGFRGTSQDKHASSAPS